MTICFNSGGQCVRTKEKSQTAAEITIKKKINLKIVIKTKWMNKKKKVPIYSIRKWQHSHFFSIAAGLVLSHNRRHRRHNCRGRDRGGCCPCPLACFTFRQMEPNKLRAFVSSFGHLVIWPINTVSDIYGSKRSNEVDHKPIGRKCQKFTHNKAQTAVRTCVLNAIKSMFITAIDPM